MLKRAEDLWKQGKVEAITELGMPPSAEHPRSRFGYSATIKSARPYKVSISGRRVDEAECTCYMGQNDMLCKHVLALAFAVLDATGGLTKEAAPLELRGAKLRVASGMKKLKPYNGPSRIWFSYQRDLATGAGMISDAISNLAPTKEHADYLWSLVMRISKKLATGGIDDSNGVIGNCVSELVIQLGTYAKAQPELAVHMHSYCKNDTGFGFEDELLNLLDAK